jgi:hypothetical protein
MGFPSSSAKLLSGVGELEGSGAGAVLVGVSGVKVGVSLGSGVEEPQALRVSAQVAVSIAMVKVFVDMWHLVNGIVGRRTLQNRCEVVHRASQIK